MARIWFFLEGDVEYVKLRDMDEVKEDLLERKFQTNPDYGIMLAPNKCEVRNFDYGFNIHYIEENVGI